MPKVASMGFGAYTVSICKEYLKPATNILYIEAALIGPLGLFSVLVWLDGVHRQVEGDQRCRTSATTTKQRPKGDVKVQTLDAGSEAQKKGMLESSICRTSAVMWPPGPGPVTIPLSTTAPLLRLAGGHACHPLLLVLRQGLDWEYGTTVLVTLRPLLEAKDAHCPWRASWQNCTASTMALECKRSKYVQGRNLPKLPT